MRAVENRLIGDDCHQRMWSVNERFSLEQLTQPQQIPTLNKFHVMGREAFSHFFFG
jgi:hypothetical protein